jgi:Na+/H+ antiporter NhaD/arsenite permease-like protein
MTALPATIFGLDPFWLSTGLLFATYTVLMVERLDRAIVALIGGALMIASGVVDQAGAIAGEDFNTLALLVGMMLLVAVARPSGMFQYLAFWSARLVAGHPAAILALMTLITALISTVLNNVTTVLLIAPVTLVITEEMRLAPYPFLFSEVLASNIGGAATLIGDPPNILIGSATGLSFNDFLVQLAPAAAIVLIVQLATGHWLWGRRMTVEPVARSRVLAFQPADAITDRPLLVKSLAVLAAAMLGFVLGDRLGLQPGTIALTAAAVLLLLDNWRRRPDEQSRRVHAAFGEVEWITIFFFVGLFVVVAGVERAGVLRWLAGALLHATGADRTVATMVVLWASALLSAAVDNIPFVATMIPVVKSMGPGLGGEAALTPIWWALALGACLGGNGTLIGASANLTVAGIAERNGIAFRFLPFLKLALPMMLLSIVISMIYIYLRYLT